MPKVTKKTERETPSEAIDAAGDVVPDDADALRPVYAPLGAPTETRKGAKHECRATPFVYPQSATGVERARHRRSARARGRATRRELEASTRRDLEARARCARERVERGRGRRQVVRTRRL